MNSELRSTLPRDLIAGLSVALILIPQSLAYAEIAGVPSYIGLYAAALPPILAAFFASSPYLQTGPVATTGLLTFGALATIADPFTSEWIALAALLALMVGLIRLIVGLLRSGAIAFLMSQPVILGFTSAAALLIVASQFPKILGYSPDGDRILVRLWEAVASPADWSAGAVVISVLTAVVVIAGRRVHTLFPGVLVAVVIGVVASSAFDFGGPVVGTIPTGLPALSLDLPWASWTSLLIPAIVIALVGFAEPAAIARQFATEERQRWNPNREFVSQGIANLASGVSGAFPVGGSFGRSSINRIAGARTRWSGGFAGAAVLLFLPVAWILEPLPLAVLGAIVIVAVAPLIRPDRIIRMFGEARLQSIIAGVTFIATLALSPRIDIAILLGIGLGIGVHLWRELTTHIDAVYDEVTLTLRPSGVMFFASAPTLFDSMFDVLSDHPEAEQLEIDLSRLGRLDYTGAIALKELLDDAEGAGLRTTVANVPQQSERIVRAVLGD